MIKDLLFLRICCTIGKKNDWLMLIDETLITVTITTEGEGRKGGEARCRLREAMAMAVGSYRNLQAPVTTFLSTLGVKHHCIFVSFLPLHFLIVGGALFY